jgi:hypothetical protein
MEAQEYVEKILAIRDASLKWAGNFDYGANVIPVIEHYVALKEPSERQSFLAAIKTMLRSEDAEQRDYAATLCLGFVVFRNVA